jgi:ribonucleoside-triphosphate reductase (thioredoxin)
MQGSLKGYVFTAKYPKYIKEKQRRETWSEAVGRVMDMHKRKYPDQDLNEIEQLYKTKVIAGSQRALQFGGAAIEEKNARLYNCIVSYCDRPAFFRECMWLLLCGCGTGISFQTHHVVKLPLLKAPNGEYTYRVEDSIEGWSNAADALLTAYFDGTASPIFDYSLVRPKGSPLRHGGVAPGSAPLERSLNRVRKVLDAAGSRLRPINAFDITMHLADAVVSGGIRRSATIGVFSVDDQEMITSKTGSWYIDNPQRGRANISAMLTPDTTREQFSKLFKSTKEYGEPGFIFAKSTEYLYNPCVEIGMCPTLVEYKGETVEEYTVDLLDPNKRSSWEAQGYCFSSGWQACNLSTVNCAAIDTEEDFYQAVSAASSLGTLQASYTDFPYLGNVSERIIRRESLLGVSLTGILTAPLFQDPEVLSKAADIAKITNAALATSISIRSASRVTCVKPEGTASIVLESSAGIHPYHAKRYIRRVQADSAEPLYKFVEKRAPLACRDSVWSAEPSAKVIAFPCSAPPSALVKADLSPLLHLAIAKIVNEAWVRTGTAIPQRLEGAYHNVSITVSVEEESWQAVEFYIWDNRELFTGVSLLGTSGDYDYQQPPYQEVYSPSEISDTDPYKDAKLAAYRYYMELCELADLDFSEAVERQDNTTQLEESACSGGSCDLPYSMGES